MPKVITVPEAAERLGVHDRTIRRWIREGRLRPYKLMGDTRRYVSVDEVEALREPQELRPVKPPVAVAVIAHGDRVLMTRRRWTEGTFSWGFPSGEVEPGEAPEAAAIREVLEEVGLTVVVTERLGERTPEATGRRLVYFACRITGGQVTLVDHEELADVRWLTLAEAERRAAAQGGIYPPVREYLEAALTAGAESPVEEE